MARVEVKGRTSTIDDSFELTQSIQRKPLIGSYPREAKGERGRYQCFRGRGPHPADRS